MNTYNDIPLNCFNTLITDKDRFATLFQVPVKEPIAEMVYVWVDPMEWSYGVDGKQLSCMDCHHYELNKQLIESGLNPDQMKSIYDTTSTIANKAHRRGWWDGEKHAKSMAILYPKG